MPNETESLGLMGCAWLIVLVVSGLVSAGFYRHRLRQPLCRARSRLRVDWDGWMVLLCFFLQLILLVLVQSLLASSAFFQTLYGPDFPMNLPKSGDESHLKEAANLRGLWANFFTVPWVVGLILVGLRFLYQVQPSQLGLTRRGFSANWVLGWLFWSILTPIVFGVYFVAILLLVDQPERHGLTQLGKYAGFLEWTIFGFSVTVLAPFLEEILFRGVMLFWLLKTPDQKAHSTGAEFTPFQRANWCYGIGLLFCLNGLVGKNIAIADLGRPLAPILFQLAVLPLYLLLPAWHRLRRWTRLRSAQEVRAILATSMFFASIHANVWPSPIPLFVLALGLGYVTVRTRSLVPAILMHSLFNSVSATYLLIGGE